MYPHPTVPPGCLLDQSLGSHEYVTANGIKFHYVTAGDSSKPLMLFVHGFPEVSKALNRMLIIFVMLQIGLYLTWIHLAIYKYSPLSIVMY